MKCFSCGHVSKEEQANFCCNCGQSLRDFIKGGNQLSAVLHQLEPGKELIAGISKTSSSSDESKNDEDEPQSLKDTSPPFKKRKKKRKRNKGKKRTDSDSSFSLISLTAEDSSIVEIGKNNDKSESFVESVADENTQTGNSDPTNKPAGSGENKTEPNDDEMSSKENAVIIKKDVPLIKAKPEDEDRKPSIEHSTSLKNKCPESMKTSIKNVEFKGVSGKNASINKKMTVDQVREQKTDISEDTNVQNDQELQINEKNKMVISESAMEITRKSKLSENDELGNKHDSQNVKNKEVSKNIPSSKKDPSDTCKSKLDTSAKSPDGRDQISNRSAVSGATLEVYPKTEFEKTNHKIPPGHKDNKDTKLDASTKVSVDENNTKCELAKNGNKNTDHNKRPENEQTTKPPNKNEIKKETETEITTDSLSESNKISIQEHAYQKDVAEKTKNKNKDKTKEQKKEDSKNNANAKKVTSSSNLSGGGGKTSNKEKADNKEKYEVNKRELNPLDRIMLYFHVIVSKDFDVNTNRDTIIVKGGGIKGYLAWEDAICKMNYTKDLEEHGFLYEGQTAVSKDCLDKYIPYKYVIVRANGEEEYEHIYNVDVKDHVHVNRCLHIKSHYVQGKEWHQYDDVCMKKNSGVVAEVKRWVKEKYKEFSKGKTLAGEVMLSRIFSILSDFDAINMYNFFIQLCQFYAVYENPLLFGDKVIQWKSLEFGSLQVKSLILSRLGKICELFLGKRKLQEGDIKNRLQAGLVCALIIYHFDITVEKNNIADICRMLCLDEMPREKMIGELQKAKTTFSKLSGMDIHLRKLCQSCIDAGVDEWVWVLPVLHEFSATSNADASHKAGKDRQEDVWAGLEGLIYDKVKKRESNILKKMVTKKYLLQVDPLLIHSWLCLIPINHMEDILEAIPLTIVSALRACYFKFPEAEYYHREKIERILKKVLQLIEKQDKPPNVDALQICCKASLDLHRIICCNKSLNSQHQLPALSAQIILTLLRISDLPQHQTEEGSEFKSQMPDLEKVLEQALLLTIKYLEDVYGHKLLTKRFNLELQAWHLILKAGENATSKWKEALLPVLVRKIKQEEAINQISIYCKEQNTFKELHSSIHKCFEDCAIEAVHLACQSETNILSKLHFYNLEKFGRLVSSVIENSWPRDNQGNFITQDSDRILQHLLTWPDATYIFKLYGTDTRIISQFGDDIQELVALSESVFLETVRNVMNGEVLFKNMEIILKHEQQFVSICKLKAEKKEKILLYEINQVLQWRKHELDTLHTEREWVDNLLKMIQSVDQYIQVDVSKIKFKHSQELGQQKLINILPVKTLNSPNKYTRLELSYYKLDDPSMTMASNLYKFRDSHVLTTSWDSQARLFSESSKMESSESEESEDDNDLTFSVEDIAQKLFNPCFKQCKKVYCDLKSENVTFEVVDKFFADFKNKYEKLKKELTILQGIDDTDNGRWISDRVKQIEQYHQLNVIFRSAEVISEVKSLFNLQGDFKTLEILLQFADDFENYKQKPLSCISTEVVKTKEILSEMNENHTACLKEVLKRQAFLHWVKEALRDINELKVFVDLASISAGENDMDVDRVACFHDAVLGYSPLLYDLKPEFGFDSFMQNLKKLWKALKSDPKLPEKLRDSARHLEWLKTVKESHGSVELSSLSLATTINKNGIYVIRAPKEQKKITPDSVLHLILPENGENNRCYTLEELKELLNKLMLMSGKGEQGNLEVDKFSEIFSNVQRLTGSFIDLYLAGNMLFRTWEAQIHCADNAKVSVLMNFDVEGIDDLIGKGALSDLLPKICKTMESFLEEWLTFVNKKRSQLYYLNYYTAEQVVYLCKQYQMRDISEEALLMLSFIKPNCAKIDTINSFYFPKTGSPAVNQPDMMDFAMELEDCTDVLHKLELVWKFSINNMGSFFPGCLDIDALGTSLAALAELNKKTVVRSLHPSFQPGQPNLIICPSSEILSCAIAVYMHSSAEPLPTYDEVLLCTPHTTFEEVALFLRRCLTPGYNGKKIYSLIYADQLSYDVGYKSEQLFQQLQSQGMDNYNLIIICNSDREHCYIPSVFSQFRIHVIPQIPHTEIHHYLCKHFDVGSNVISAASVFKNGMSAGIVSSKRGGVGKSLYVKRLFQKLESRFLSKKPLLKIIRLIKPEVDEKKVLETLLPFIDGKLKSCPIIFHIDITSSVTSGISEFLFKLLVLQYLMDSQGRIWKRLPSHLYLIEILEPADILSGEQFKNVPRIVQNDFIDFFPKIFCCSPKEVFKKTTEADAIDCGDPGMDIEEFRSECFQRTYQYLIRFEQKQNLDEFVYREGHTEGDPAKCLQIFLLYCGIMDPSWSELRNFAWFLNLQLRDCESSVFCNHLFVGDTLQGFKNFVVNFMILMAKDFATPSLYITDQSPGRYRNNPDGVKEQDLVPFLMRKRWESEPHPYIFFNEDHASMTFIGFHLQPNNAGGVDATNPRNNEIITHNVMSSGLYEGLRLQRVPFNTDFDQLPRHEKISRLCMVLGIQWPIDPDETYELTMDNMLKILAIKMRFRCGIPVVIMGETGCGKTRLIKFLCHLCKGFVETENMKLVKVHGGTSAETIYQKILEAQEIAQINKKEGCETVLFFDEANTTEAISSIKEALCDHTVDGEPLKKDSGLHIIAACNPYRKHTDDMIKRLESAGLGYKVRADETKERLGSIPLRQLVYRVHALPPSMLPLVWDFGQLNNETEKKYIQQIVRHLANEIQISTNNIQLLTDVLSASQSYMRDKNDECSFVSLRDVERCIEVFKWFYNHHEKLLNHYSSSELRKASTYDVVDKAAWSLILAVGVCYHASLETKDSYRRAICKFFPQPYKDPTNILKEITSIQDLFLAGVHLRDTIARNLALKENLFMMVICIELKIPLFLVGKPGSSKSLAKTIVADAMQGQTAHTELYKDLKQVHLVSFQCSPHSTPEGIIGTFRHCARFQEGKNLNEYVSVVVLDEIGLAEDSPKMPLKTLHPLLEDGCIDDDTSPHKKVGFIGISNWALDPAKMNRGIFVSRGDPNEKELIESAKGICFSNKCILSKILRYFRDFSEAYLEVCKTLKEQEKEFFGLRDFYSLIKMVFAFTKQSDSLTQDQIARAVLRNFSGKDEVNALEIFLKDKTENIADISTTDLIMENIRSDSDDCRYLLILTKNYAALQILQQAFLKENQQPEIIFGSSFPKDQEYTQICRNINRVKICMETGQMVILLNLQNLYESLYDALNQYYVYLAGQKYVDLGLGTHRVKCRVHPKFRLVVIEEKETVYKDFPVPLINRLEKHYLDINTFLKKEQKVIVKELEDWVKDFTKGNQNHIIGKAQTYKPSDVFIGYHSDTCAAVVLQVTENIKQTHLNTENTTDSKNKAIQVLLNCATPDSVIRLGRKDLIDDYFKKQQHGSLLDFLCCHVTTNNDNHTVFTEITTFSRLLTSADRKVLETELRSHISSIEILSLQQFDTEFSFLKKIRSLLKNSSGNLILLIQTDFEEGSQGANLVASAKYSAVNEIQKVKITEVSVFVYFITKLPRMQGGTSYVGFRGGLWQSIHIDDLRKSKDMVEDITAFQDLTISHLFYTEGIKEPVKDATKHKTNMETKMEVELANEDKDSVIQVENDEEDMMEKMDIDTAGKMESENETVEDQEMEIDVPSLPRSEDMLDTTILIRSCVQNAIGLLRDDENVESRSTRRIEILISLLSTENLINSSFLKMLKCRLHKLLKAQEDNILLPEQWVIREAANQDALQEAGTFRQALWKRVQAAITPLLSQILSVVDCNANLNLLVDPGVKDYVKSLWMHIFQDKNLLSISDSHSSQTKTILVRNCMNISEFGENHFPYSWRIKDYLEDIWTHAQHIDNAEGPERKFLEIFCKTPLGKYYSSQDENAQQNLFLNYKRDFILMTLGISSVEELQIMELTLSAYIKELGLSAQAREPLLLPWVHIGYSKFQHRLQNLNRILVVRPSVLEYLRGKIDSVKLSPEKGKNLDIYAAIACLETLKDSMQRSDPQEWMQQVKNIQVPIELTCSEGYLHGQGSGYKMGIRQIRKLWNCVFSMALFMEHLLVKENLQDENMQGLVKGHTFFLGRCLEDFTDIKDDKPFLAVVNALHKCRTEVAESVSRFGMQLCPICRGDPNEPVCLECDHVFCQSCLKQWLDTGNKTCPYCTQPVSENFKMVVSKEIRESIQKNIDFRKQCNGFFVDIVCNMCFKDNSPPDDKVIRHLLSFLFEDTESASYTRSLSPFEDAVDKTPVIRSVLLKLLLKYSFDLIMKHAQEYLSRVKRSNLMKAADTKEVYLLFINCLEDSLYEKKQKLQNDNETLKYFEEEMLFLQNYLSSSRRQSDEETSVQLLQNVARLRLALDVAAEMLSVKNREVINEQYLRCVKDLCAQSGNDWYRVYLIRKLANLDGIDTLQRHFNDPKFAWLFPRGLLQNKDTEVNHVDHFLVCGESYKVLREGISRAMMEGKKERIATAIEECKSRDQELSVYLLLAAFREITLYYGIRKQATVPEQDAVMNYLKDANIFKDRSLNQFLETLLNNNRQIIHAVPGMGGSHVTIFGLAVHLASILLSNKNHLLTPLKNLSFSSARMQNSYLPTMPEDMLTKARTAMTEQLQWYECPNRHYCAVGECGQPMQTARCPDCGANVGGVDHTALQGFRRIQQNVDRTQTGHVLGDPNPQGSALAPDRDIPAPAFILLRMITHLAMLLGSEEDMQSLMRIVKPPVQNISNFILLHIEKDLEYLKNSLGKSTDDTTTVVHLILNKMLRPEESGNWPVNFDDVWSAKEMRNAWEKHFVAMVIAPVLRSLDGDLMNVNNYIRQDDRISSNPVVKVVYGDPLISGEKMDLPRDSNVHCSKIWSCRERICIEYILHAVQQKDGKDTLPLLWKFLEKETELQMVKFLPNILKLQKDLVKKFQNYKEINFKTIKEFICSITSDGSRYIFEKHIQEFMLSWNHLRLSLKTNGEIKLPEGMCDEILTMESNFEFLLPRRQGLGLGATALTSYLIALHNSFIYEVAKYTNIEQKYSIKASEVMDLHVISYELEKDLVPIVLSNCQYSLESGKETLQEFDFPKIQDQLITRLLQGKPRITIAGLPTLTLSHDRNYEDLFTDVKKRLPQDSLSNSAIDVLSKDLNAFSDVCEALNIVDISLGFLASSGGDPELSLTEYAENVLQMGEQSSAHILEALKRCHLKKTIALWQLLTALKSQHLLHLKRDPFANVDKAYKQKLDRERQHALNMFLEQNGINCFLLELHEMIMLKLRKSQSVDNFKPSWSLKDVLVPLLDDKGISFQELENDFPEQIALAHCIEAWKFTAIKKWNRNNHM
ncbi:E3 ubiquitin-protein ligase RNF213 [Pyxicephalus adspersus]|uniref:E3 ubiquitin-protein ligase RNF213 n=1 Tax=Pyxicephalus adspersus TaxID=30357 RepID=UPI003B5C451C